jgi:hypothetical protein
MLIETINFQSLAWRGFVLASLVAVRVIKKLVTPAMTAPADTESG